MGLRKSYRRLINHIKRISSGSNSIDLELERINLFPAFKVGIANVFDRPFKFHDGKNFVSTYKELFVDRIYQFMPSKTDRTILDCGANMGLSVLFFAINYPQHQIIAFEPDAVIFNILQENVSTFGLKNVTLYQKAVWTKKETLRFFSDGGMGGRVENEYRNQNPKLIEAVPLSEYLTDDVDFLKIDIEGAEDVVVKSCEGSLHKANTIFFEYHNDVHKEQTLDELLTLVKKQGFQYYLKESFVRQKPFVDSDLVCESFDMAINVFCYKNQ